MTVARPDVAAGRTRAVVTYDGVDAASLRDRLGLPRVVLHDVVRSTMDEAHALAAEGAPGGTAVLADMQVAGRGRQGREWRSEAGQGVWVTIVERPVDTSGIEVLSLRVGLALAEGLEPLAPGRISLKWPNDVYVGHQKLAGILIEARWRDGRLDWVAIGVGVNVRPPAGAGASLREGITRLDALARVVTAIRTAAAAAGALDDAELARFHARDLAVGRTATAPSPGIVAGIDASGALTIVGPRGARRHRAGSLLLAGDP